MSDRGGNAPAWAAEDKPNTGAVLSRRISSLRSGNDRPPVPRPHVRCGGSWASLACGGPGPRSAPASPERGELLARQRVGTQGHRQEDQLPTAGDAFCPSETQHREALGPRGAGGVCCTESMSEFTSGLRTALCFRREHLLTC